MLPEAAALLRAAPAEVANGAADKTKMKVGGDIPLEFEYDFYLMNRDYFSTCNQKTIIYEAEIVPVMNWQGSIVGHSER